MFEEIFEQRFTNAHVLENKRSNNKDSYYLKDNRKELEIPYE